MSVANAVLDVMLADGFLDRVVQMSRRLRDRLMRTAAKFPHIISDVRGLGLLVGLHCKVPNTDLQLKLRERGLLTATAGDNVVRILPPLIVSTAEVDEACSILEAACAAWTA
jgi:acetylornithine/N-succinyldiaminopimelate aminotransferase